MSIRVGSVSIISKETVRYPGVELDASLTLTAQISQVCRMAYLNMRLISRLSRCMDVSTKVVAVKALVCSRVEYCVSIHNGVSKKNLSRLQRVLRSAQRATAWANSKSDQATSEWLTIEQMISLRILVTVYWALHGMAPRFVCGLLNPEDNVRCLRSSDKNQLKVPRTSKVVGGRAFSATAPRLWNGIGLEIRNASSVASDYFPLNYFLLTLEANISDLHLNLGPFTFILKPL